VVLATCGTVFVWLRLTDWQSGPWGGSLWHEWVGGPVEFLFIPSLFFWLDLRRKKPRSPLGWIARSMTEVFAFAVWPFFWTLVELLLGWRWI
jgi:hypothetical protein